MKPPQIRRARRKDLKGILGVAASTKVFSSDELECLEGDLEDFLNTENSDRFFVYEEDGRILAFAEWGPLPITSRSWMLHWIAVDKSAQGKGVGKRLMEKVEKDARKNARVLFIETSSREEYEDTRCFYMKCGFFPCCIVPDYYSYGDSKVVYSKLVGDFLASG